MAIDIYNEVGGAIDFKRVEVQLTSDTPSSGVGGNLTDVAGSSIELSPGTWVIGYSVLLLLDQVDDASRVITANVRITDSSDNLVDGSISAIGNKNFTTEITLYEVTKQVEVTVDTTTTYKLKIGCRQDDTESTVTAVADSFESTAGLVDIFSEPDNNSIFWAERKEL